MPNAQLVSRTKIRRSLVWPGAWPGPPGARIGVPGVRGERRTSIATGALLVAAALLAIAPHAAADLRFDPLDPQAQAADPTAESMPPGFPKGWRLTVESPIPGTSAWQTQVALDPSTGTVRERYRAGNVEVREPLVAPTLDYNELLTERTERRLWRERTKSTRSVNKTVTRRGAGLVFKFPLVLPPAVRSIVGNGAPSIEVSGSERISILGTSDWLARGNLYQGISGERQRQGAFPAFEMKQELSVNMTGSIGDKIKVDVDQSSNVSTNLDNKVKLRYEGDEDDMIKTIDLGNTNLSLQGASLRQEGLFGIKTAAKMGNFDVTLIASKQDAKTETARFTPSGEKRAVKVTDIECIRRTYYFIADHPIDASAMNLIVYRADPSYNATSFPGDGRLDPTLPADSISTPGNPQQFGRWLPLTIGQDYDLIYPYVLTNTPGNVKIPVIRLRAQLGTSQMLGVSYYDLGRQVQVGLTDKVENLALGKPAGEYLLLKMLKPPEGEFTTTANDLFDRNAPWFPALAYELRNFYDLGGREIDRSSLSIKVRKIDNSLPTHPDEVGGVPLVRILGLDHQGKAGSDEPFQPDGLVDDQFIDTDTGIMFFPDLHPFAPDTSAAYRALCGPDAGGFLCLDNLKTNTLWADSNFVNLNVYYDRQPDPGKDERYFIDAEFKSSQQGFYLGRFGILENSEQVKVDGIPQRRVSDYRIDYDTGLLTFTKAPGPEQVITADFSYAPGFGQVQRSLVGFSGGYNPSSNFSLSSSLLREARGAQETNPKLGEEPATSMLGDFGAVMSFRPFWMTRLADQVPGITTDQQSALNVQGNFSVSLPNPNTKGEAYIDDMEGNRESNTIGLGRLSWFWSSVPVNRQKPRKAGLPPADSIANAALTPVSSLVTDHARLEWFNPRPDGPTAAQEWDIKPVLKQSEGGDNNHQVLELNVRAPDDTTLIDSADWTGITQSLSTVGQDFSRVRFVEVWVNDFTKDHDSTKAYLHLSLGRVSEDAFWSPSEAPNLKLDTEDKNFDGKLDLGSGEDDPNFEDTGLDGIVNKNEPGYNATTNPDPNQDNYDYDVRNNANDFSTINRFERNGLGEANARPDTEDLNRNTILDSNNNYYEASIDLADTQFVAIDVPVLYPSASYTNVKADNGWRLFRIPINGDTFRPVGSPSWQNIQHLRLWVSGIERPIKIQVGGVEFAGSRWLEAAILDPDMTARDVELDVRSRNNKDDAGIYQPPYEVQNQVGSSADRREQSLALGYTRMAEGDTLLAFKTLGDPGTGLGWAQYRQIKFYVHGEQGVETQNLRAVARFGPDTLNYYEYSLPVRTDWQKITIPMETLSRLKEVRSDSQYVYVDSLTGAASSEVFTVVGNPSFTRISRLSFGLAVKGSAIGAPPASGEVWIDELRLADVRRETGTSSNVSIQANFADLLALNVSLQKQDQNFFRVGQGGNQGSGLDHTALGFSTTLNVDRFLPASNITLPVRLSVQHATDVPKFRTGSDVTLDAGQSDIETRRLDQQTLDVSYRRSSSIRRGISKYTIDAISSTMSYSRRASINPQSAESSWAFSSSFGYDLPIGGGGFRLGKKFRVGLLPEVIGFNVGWRSERSLVYSREIFRDDDSVTLRSDVKVRLLSLGTNVSYVPFSSVRVQYTLNSTRDMLDHREGPMGFNKGKEVEKNQTASVNWTPRWLSFLQPNVTLKGQYNESARRELRLAPTDPQDLKSIRNNGAANLTMSLPISRLGGGGRHARPAAGGAKKGESFSPLAPFRGFFRKMQDIQTSFTFDRGATLSRVVGDAGVPFKSGFSEVTAEDLRNISGSNGTTNRRFTTRASTAFRPSSSLTIDIRGDHSLSFTDQSFGERRTQRVQWPDLQGRWVDVHRHLHLDQTLTSLTVRSGYSHVADEDGPLDAAVERTIKTDTYGPILGWDFVFRNGVRASVASSLTRAATIDARVYGVTRDKKTTNSDVRVTKTFPAAKGIHLPFSKKTIRLPNDLNLNLTCNLAGDRQIVSRSGERNYTESDTKSLKVGTGTTYNFSRAITGGFNFEYRQNDDRKLGIKRRGITVDLNAAFTF